VHRVLYENSTLRRLAKDLRIDIVYNFCGSRQLFLGIPQLIKVQNLLFYSNRLDQKYISDLDFKLWFFHILIKRLFFRFMLDKSNHIEIQANHVKNSLADFIDVNNKQFYVKSDIDVSASSFNKPRNYDFSKKLHFLFIVGPHFEYKHKNIADFARAMVRLRNLGVDFYISITLSREQLGRSDIWDKSLDKVTNFCGYISDSSIMASLFGDNTILISTSVIETLGLHVVDAIKKGIIIISPNEDYALDVYGNNLFTYELFDSESLVSTIEKVIDYRGSHADYIRDLQEKLVSKEASKYKNIGLVFDSILNQKG
jgi:hypothetical protein